MGLGLTRQPGGWSRVPAALEARHRRRVADVLREVIISVMTPTEFPVASRAKCRPARRRVLLYLFEKETAI
jgi:hypothetical protein